MRSIIRKLLTEFYDGDELKVLNAYYIKQLSGLSDENPKSLYLAMYTGDYFDKLNNKISYFKKLSELSKNGTGLFSVDDILHEFEIENGAKPAVGISFRNILDSG